MGSGSPPALWGTCGGLLTLLQPCWGDQGRAEVQRGLWKAARGGAALLLLIQYHTDALLAARL